MPLRPEQFWRYTPNEVRDMVAGAQKREERAWERVAWQTAHTMNVAGKVAKKRITPDELLGRNRHDPSQTFSELWNRVQKDWKRMEQRD